MSVLSIRVRRAGGGERLYIDIDSSTAATTRQLDGVAEHLLGDALRGVDQILGLGNPGPCERWIAGDQS